MKRNFFIEIYGEDTVFQNLKYEGLGTLATAKKIIKTANIYLKYSNEGKIYFNSRKARDFFSDYLEDRFFMTFCGYEGRPDNCYFCGGKSTIKRRDSRFKIKSILLCDYCDSQLTRVLK